MGKKIYIITALFILGGYFYSSAQEIQISGGGFTSNHPKGEKLFHNVYEGYTFGVEYHYYLSNHWSVGSGLSYLHGYFSYQDIHPKGAYPATDVEGDPLEFRYRAQLYAESSKWYQLCVPLVVQFETSGDIRWYMQTGLLLGFTLGKSTAQMDWNKLHTSGYYEQWDAELNGPKFVGFGDWGAIEKEQKVKFKNSYSWTIETGIKGLFNRNYLYFGVFANIGLNDLRPKETKSRKAIEYIGSESQPLKYHSVWQQKRFEEKGLRNNLFGLRIRYGIAFK